MGLALPGLALANQLYIALMVRSCKHSLADFITTTVLYCVLRVGILA